MTSDRFGYNQRIPGQYRDLFAELCQDLLRLHAVWKFYRGLFGTDEETVNLLNDCAPAAFYFVQQTLMRDLVMAISRLNDPPKSSGKANLSLEALVEKSRQDAPGVDQLLEDFRNACKPLKHYRNKRVGHRDLNVALQAQSNASLGFSRSDISKIIDIAGEILNTVYQAHIDGELYFDGAQAGSRAAQELICALSD